MPAAIGNWLSEYLSVTAVPALAFCVNARSCRLETHLCLWPAHVAERRGKRRPRSGLGSWAVKLRAHCSSCRRGAQGSNAS